MILSSTQPVVSTNVNDNSNMMHKSYQDQDLPTVLPRFTPGKICDTHRVFSVVFYR